MSRKTTKETNENNFLNKKVVDENITKCYINKVASAAMSSLKTERNKQRETSIFILDARQTNFIGEFDHGS
ncbi:hypothetical protein U2I54_16705, partial [Bacillus pseudomycoides]|nr:hypothetical protein [Bacillus pseudomycoides]